MADVLVLDSIAALRTATIASDVDAIFVRAYSLSSLGVPLSTRGGGLFQRVPGTVTPPFGDDGVFTFQNGSTFWTRNLSGGTVDAYMAGAIGGATLAGDGTLASGVDDSLAINTYLAAVFRYQNSRANSLEVRFALGEGTFYVANPLYLSYFDAAPRSWVMEATGTTILGGCARKPVIDLTDRRFGTLRNAQVIGLVDAMGQPISSCGVRVGRNADNDAANQMTMDHVGIRGHFHLAAMLNVAAEQFAALGCEFANEAAGDKYGYAADAYNCLQWTRPLQIQMITSTGGGVFTVTASGNNLVQSDYFLVRGAYAGAEVLNTVLFQKTSSGAGSTFTAEASPNLTVNLSGGVLYKRLYGGAVDTPDLTPWQPASFKEQYHRQGNYRAPRGTAAMLETCDSQHVFEAMHPTCSFYPEATTAAAPAAKAVISSVVKSSPTDPRTIVNIVTPPASPFSDNQLVSIYGVTGAVAGDINGRLFIVAGAGLVAGQFELRDIDGSPIDSSGWDLGDAGYGGSAVVRQKVADGNDPYAGGFGMRMIVGADAGCDVSRYLMHHEAGTASATDPVTGAVFNGETMWWASIESFEGWLNAGVTGFTPPPVTLSDVTFAEPAGHGRAGFLLARRERTTGVTMLGGRIALTQAARGFGNTGLADKLLTATGTGPNPWTLANTDLVVDQAALVDASRLAGFSGRLTAEDTAFAAGIAAAYPGTLAVIQALAGQPQSTIRSSARLTDALLGTLETAGLLAKLDALHVFAVGNEAAARVNLADPKRGLLTLAGSGSTPPGFAPGYGYTGAGAVGRYLQSPQSVTTPGVQYNLVNAMMGVVSRSTGPAAVNPDISLATTVAYVDPYSGSPAKYVTRANDGAAVPTTMTGQTNPAGFFAWSRTSGGGYAKYRGAGADASPAAVAVTSTASGPLPNASIDILRGATHQLSAAFYGAGLTAAEVTTLYAALKTYLTVAGVWI